MGLMQLTRFVLGSKKPVSRSSVFRSVAPRRDHLRGRLKKLAPKLAHSLVRLKILIEMARNDKKNMSLRASIDSAGGELFLQFPQLS